MTHVPTELERQAATLRERALHLIDAAREALQEAENALLQEERKHEPHISPANQHRIEAYTEAANDLNDVWEKITGEPRVKVISGKVTGVRRIFSGEVVGDRAL